MKVVPLNTTHNTEVEINVNKNCRICYETDNQEEIIEPCLCQGSIKYAH